MPTDGAHKHDYHMTKAETAKMLDKVECCEWEACCAYDRAAKKLSKVEKTGEEMGWAGQALNMVKQASNLTGECFYGL